MKSWQQPSFVFVHGGDHGSWCWAQVQRHLTRPSLAGELPGRTGTQEAQLAAYRGPCACRRA